MYDVEKQFKTACEEICKEFSFDYGKVRFSDPLPFGSVGQIYECTMKKKNFEVVFTVETFESEKDVSDDKIKAKLAIRPISIRKPFVFYLHGTSLGFIHSTLLHWVKCTIYDYNVENNPFDFKLHFYDALIKICGFPRYSTPTNNQLTIILSGLGKVAEDFVVYRFRHINKQKNISYSYSIYVHPRLWLFFPDAAGGGGGGGEEDFRLIENMLNKIPKNKLKREYWDIPYDEFEKYIGENEAKFEYPITVEKKSKLSSLLCHTNHYLGIILLQIIQNFVKS